ncbi:hypothetical protein ACFL2V_05530 [Pseudomonadota bacterium]
MTYRNTWTLAATPVLMGLLLTACGGDSVSLSKENWQCENKQCDIDFVLTNPGTAPVNAHYAIRAQSSVQTITSDLRGGLVVAEIKESVTLAAGESKTLTHQLEATRPPTNVVFSAWVK